MQARASVPARVMITRFAFDTRGEFDYFCERKFAQRDGRFVADMERIYHEWQNCNELS